jgi:hypothetical protein
MRIRKQISPWNVKMFLPIALFVFLLFNALILFLNYLDAKPLLSFSFNWIFSGLVNPFLIASIFTNTFRRTTLFINDYQNIEAFADKLKKSILDKGVAERSSTDTVATYAATGWFYKLFNNWDGSETVTVKWGDEVIIQGSSRIVSQIEDSLTWNAAFK